ncbi:unnamed protein product [Phytomonas sp. Hart1]|nr:unnamed protein product [Phytomonas sp. Hart1]|eukprot:CCW67633.1 unnamed protein product [Phytomonas sp. isolate Hart1]
MDATSRLINNTSSARGVEHSAVKTQTTNFVDPSNLMHQTVEEDPNNLDKTMTILPNGESAKVASPNVNPSPSSSPLEPIIQGAVQYKYYRVPASLKALRPKRKVAIVFGYIGEKYCGLQWNHQPNYPTIEEALLKAMFECDLISLENFSSSKVQQLIGFERASRTDKGVHALRNVVSANITLPYNAAYAAVWEREKTGTNPLEINNKNNNNNGNDCVINRKDEGSSSKAALSLGDSSSPSQEGVNRNLGTKEVNTTIALSDEVANNDDNDDLKYSYEEAKRLLNMALPSDIVVYDVVPVTRSFNAYLCCGGRCYEYYLPTFALMPRELFVSRFFPASLASSYPSENDADVTLCFQKYESRNLEGTEEEEGNSDSVSYKRRGHFPMRKGKRRRLSALDKDQPSPTEDGKCEEPNEDVTTEAGKDKKDSDELLTPNAAIGAETNKENNEPGEKEVDAADSSAMMESMLLFRSIPPDMMREVAANYRLSHEQLQHVRDLFRGYEGTHPFHNFTPGGRRGDPSCHRFIQQINVSEPFIVHPKDKIVESLETWTPSRFFSPDEAIAEAYRARWAAVKDEKNERREPKEEKEDNLNEIQRVERLRREVLEHICSNYGEAGLEVVRIEIIGQSFMLNQIRKMIGAVIAMLAAGLPASFLEEKLLQKHATRRYGIPMAPANGLLLSSLEFNRYNYRLERIQKDGGNAKDKRCLEVEKVPAEEVSQQRERTMAVMLRNEMANDIMGKWMRSLRCVLRIVWGIEMP